MHTKSILFLLLVVYFATASLYAQGLQGEYYNGQNFEEKVLTRTDPQINFIWNNVAAAPGLDPHVFSVRWTGKIQAPETGTYYFRAHVDDGIRVKIDGKTVIESWGLNDSKGFSGEIVLQGGRQYALQVEYFNAMLEGEIQLFWQLPSEAPTFKGLFGYNDHLIEGRFFTPPPPQSVSKSVDSGAPKPVPPATPRRVAPKLNPIPLKKANVSKDTLEKYIPKTFFLHKVKAPCCRNLNRNWTAWPDFYCAIPSIVWS